ncbi:MAG: cyclic nucleotide-binding domain-containing protein [Victivallales bacterium]|nr:cyclic nucleotide-binding domain-containing protein [Victivallales bacterium]
MDIKKSLKDLSVFSSLNDDEMQAVADICKTRTIAANELVFEYGAQGDDLFIVLKGCIKIYTQITENVNKTLITLREGGLFGELAVISEDYRSASAMALENTELISITRDNFEKLLEDNPAVGKKILNVFIRIIANRLKNTTELYKQAVDWGLSISGILELNYSQLINQRSQISIDLNSGKNVSGILLKADKNDTGLELLLQTEKEKLVMIPYGAISAISFDQVKTDTEQE